MARLVFLDAHTRDLYADWPTKARAVVGNLRLVAGRHPDDTALHALVGELSSKSPDFASMWADHRVTACAVATYEMRHPLVGPLTVTQQTLSQGPGQEQDHGQNIVVATTEADSTARTTLALLDQVTSQHDPARQGFRGKLRLTWHTPQAPQPPPPHRRTAAACPKSVKEPCSRTSSRCPRPPRQPSY